MILVWELSKMYVCYIWCFHILPNKELFLWRHSSKVFLLWRTSFNLIRNRKQTFNEHIYIYIYVPFVQNSKYNTVNFPWGILPCIHIFIKYVSPKRPKYPIHSNPTNNSWLRSSRQHCSVLIHWYMTINNVLVVGCAYINISWLPRPCLLHLG